MRNKKREKISKEKLENERQRLKNASVIDEITVNVPKEAIIEEDKKKKNNFRKKHDIKINKEEHESIDKTETEVQTTSEIDLNNDNHNEDINDNYDISSSKTLRRKKRSKKKHNVLKVILVIILAIMIYFGYKLIKGMNQNGWTLGGFVATMLGHDANTLANLSRVNVLLVGQSQTLTDTLLVCSYDPKTQEAALLSIPRDTFVGKNKNYASAYDKINAVFQDDPEKLMEKVRNITELDIKYYIKVDTQGLRELVDSVGGIYFYVPIDMDYDDPSQDLYIHVKQGYQLLNGDKAEQVLRFRHNNDGTTYPKEYGEQDLGRMKTQRAFLTEVLKQLVKPKNITEIDDYIRIANNNVETNFSIWTLKDYAPYLLDFKTENLKTATLPGTTEKLNNLWFYAYNKKETQKVIAELFKTKLTEEQEQNTKISVKILNGTSDENNLVNLENLLKENGYTVESTGNTSLTQKTTIMNRTKQSNEIANKLKETIGVGIIANSSNETDSTVDFTIIIGDDYI